MESRAKRRQRIKAVASAVVLWVLFATLAAAIPASAQLQELSCRVAESPDGFTISWTLPPAETGQVQPDRVVIERKVSDQWWWRGRASPTDPSFADQGAPAATGQPPTAQVAYRLSAKAGEQTVASVPCRQVQDRSFRCDVSVLGTSYRIGWLGGPVGADVDYVVERDVNPENIYHWRGRTDDTTFVDQIAQTPPNYRVTARVAKVPVGAADCDASGPLAVRLNDAAFVCPVPGSTFTDTWHAPRDGGARKHKGVDMFAPRHSPVLAPEDGKLSFSNGQRSGVSFALLGDSGTWYFGAHLQAAVGENRRVVAGEQIGTIGNSGNAVNTPTHLHFQIHPGGRGTPAVNPTPPTSRACL